MLGTMANFKVVQTMGGRSSHIVDRFPDIPEEFRKHTEVELPIAWCAL
ncbi:hypothetical protein ACFL4V_01290 [Candidatus Latescibacterota bacterium]